MADSGRLDNEAPVVYTKKSQRRIEDKTLLLDLSIIDPVDSLEVFLFIHFIFI